MHDVRDSIHDESDSKHDPRNSKHDPPDSKHDPRALVYYLRANVCTFGDCRLNLSGFVVHSAGLVKVCWILDIAIGIQGAFGVTLIATIHHREIVFRLRGRIRPLPANNMFPDTLRRREQSVFQKDRRPAPAQGWLGRESQSRANEVVCLSRLQPKFRTVASNILCKRRVGLFWSIFAWQFILRA